MAMRLNKDDTQRDIIPNEAKKTLYSTLMVDKFTYFAFLQSREKNK